MMSTIGSRQIAAGFMIFLVWLACRVESRLPGYHIFSHKLVVI